MPYICQVRWGRGLKCRGNQGFNNKIKQKNINHPEGEKQAGRQKTGTQSTSYSVKDTRKTTDQHRTADTRRLYRETNEGNEGDTAEATETMIK